MSAGVKTRAAATSCGHVAPVSGFLHVASEPQMPCTNTMAGPGHGLTVQRARTVTSWAVSAPAIPAGTPMPHMIPSSARNVLKETPPGEGALDGIRRYSVVSAKIWRGGEGGGRSE